MGFTNQVTGSHNMNPIFSPPVLEFCEAVYPSHDRVPPHLRGQPCTPRTKFRQGGFAREAFRRMQQDDQIRGGLRLRTEKAAETRKINQAAKARNEADDSRRGR